MPAPRTAGRPAAAADNAGTTGTRRFSLFGAAGGSGSSSSSKSDGSQKTGTGTTGARGLSLFGSKTAAGTSGTQKAGTQRAVATQRVAASAAAVQKQKAAPQPRTAGRAANAAATGTQRLGTQGTAGTRRQARLAAAAAAASPAAPRASDQEYLNVTGYPFPLGPFLKRPTIRKELVRGVMWGFEQPQSLGGSNVTTNIRMTIVRLQSGGLWVHAPIAPTREWLGLLGEAGLAAGRGTNRAGSPALRGGAARSAAMRGPAPRAGAWYCAEGPWRPPCALPAGECVRMVRQLEEETGESVRYIILPTFGYEHKVGRGGWALVGQGAARLAPSSSSSSSSSAWPGWPPGWVVVGQGAAATAA